LSLERVAVELPVDDPQHVALFSLPAVLSRVTAQVQQVSGASIMLKRDAEDAALAVLITGNRASVEVYVRCVDVSAFGSARCSLARCAFSPW
jgi:hypothetical protein